MKSAVENDRTFSLYQRLNIMRIPRIYHPESLKNQSTCQLSEDAANHVGRVLRMTEGEHFPTRRTPYFSHQQVI